MMLACCPIDNVLPYPSIPSVSFEEGVRLDDLNNYMLLRTNVDNAIFKIQILSIFLSVLFLSVSSTKIDLELRG
jgi:hypothetical protein